MITPSVTVKDVWRSVLPEGTELLAGGGGLERRVEWACALRARPPAFDAIRGGELAFVPVNRIRYVDARLDLAQVMTSFAEKGGVAVAISGEPTSASIELADRLVMPLLHLPDRAHLADVHQACVRFILDQRTMLHERAQELQTALMQLALSGASRHAIVDRLAELTQLPSCWLGASAALDRNHTLAPQIAASIEGHAPSLRRWSDTIPVAAADPPVTELTLDDTGTVLLVSPVPGRQGVGGFVGVVASGVDAIDQRARLAVSRAASACAIDLDRERAVMETREQLEGELVSTLVTGAYASDEAALDRCKRLGVTLGSVVQVSILRGSRTFDSNWERAALAAVRNALTRRQTSALSGVHNGDLCVIFSDEDPAHFAERVTEELRRDCAHVTGDSVSAGVGRPGTGPAAARTSYREAEQALMLALRAIATGITASFARLGLYRMLFALAQHTELAEFYEETVGALVAYDERTGGELMTTLDALFETNGSPTEAAQRLRLHRNTVLYRLRRIEEIADLNLDDPLTRLNLHLCMRIRDVLHQEPLSTRRRAARTA